MPTVREIPCGPDRDEGRPAALGLGQQDLVGAALDDADVRTWDLGLRGVGCDLSLELELGRRGRRGPAGLGHRDELQGRDDGEAPAGSRSRSAWRSASRPCGVESTPQRMRSRMPLPSSTSTRGSGGGDGGKLMGSPPSWLRTGAAAISAGTESR